MSLICNGEGWFRTKGISIAHYWKNGRKFSACRVFEWTDEREEAGIGVRLCPSCLAELEGKKHP